MLGLAADAAPPTQPASKVTNRGGGRVDQCGSAVRVGWEFAWFDEGCEGAVGSRHRRGAQNRVGGLGWVGDRPEVELLGSQDGYDRRAVGQRRWNQVGQKVALVSRESAIG